MAADGHSREAQLAGQLAHRGARALPQEEEDLPPGRHQTRGYRTVNAGRPPTDPAAPAGRRTCSVGAVSRLERLINLVAALLETERPLSADELRRRVPGYPEELGSFRRAFERDKEALREMGIPIAVETVDADSQTGLEGYRIHKDSYYLRDPGLASDELAALHLAASAVKLDGANGMEALWKLGGEVAESGPAQATAALPGAIHLAPVFSAISAGRSVTFEYRDRTRSVDPWRLAFRNGHWYLTGRDRNLDEQRSFRLDRIASAVQLGPETESSRPEEVAAPPPWEMGDEAPVFARLRVDADQAGWALSQMGQASLEHRRPDGSMVLRVRVTNRDAFRSFVLGFLERAEVLGPTDLRLEMVAWLDDVIATSARPA